MKSKKKKIQVKQKVGRKWFDGKDEKKVLANLKYVWGIGGSDAEAAFYADISVFSLSRYIKANPEVEELRNKLHQKPILKARETLMARLADGHFATWYLERKRREEFVPSQKIEHSGSVGFSLKITADDDSNTLGTDEETGGGVAVPNR